MNVASWMAVAAGAFAAPWIPFVFAERKGGKR